MLRSRNLLPHTDAIEALWGANSHGAPLFAQYILAIDVARLRRAGHAIENYRGIGYRIRESAGGMADQTLARPAGFAERLVMRPIWFKLRLKTLRLLAEISAASSKRSRIAPPCTVECRTSPTPLQRRQLGGVPKKRRAG